MHFTPTSRNHQNTFATTPHIPPSDITEWAPAGRFVHFPSNAFHHINPADPFNGVFFARLKELDTMSWTRGISSIHGIIQDIAVDVNTVLQSPFPVIFEPYYAKKASQYLISGVDPLSYNELVDITIFVTVPSGVNTKFLFRCIGQSIREFLTAAQLPGLNQKDVKITPFINESIQQLRIQIGAYNLLFSIDGKIASRLSIDSLLTSADGLFIISLTRNTEEALRDLSEKLIREKDPYLGEIEGDFFRIWNLVADGYTFVDPAFKQRLLQSYDALSQYNDYCLWSMISSVEAAVCRPPMAKAAAVCNLYLHGLGDFVFSERTCVLLENTIDRILNETAENFYEDDMLYRLLDAISSASGSVYDRRGMIERLLFTFFEEGLVDRWNLRAHNILIPSDHNRYISLSFSEKTRNLVQAKIPTKESFTPFIPSQSQRQKPLPAPVFSNNYNSNAPLLEPVKSYSDSNIPRSASPSNHNNKSIPSSQPPMKSPKEGPTSGPLPDNSQKNSSKVESAQNDKPKIFRPPSTIDPRNVKILKRESYTPQKTSSSESKTSGRGKPPHVTTAANNNNRNNAPSRPVENNNRDSSRSDPFRSKGNSNILSSKSVEDTKASTPSWGRGRSNTKKEELVGASQNITWGDTDWKPDDQ